MSLLSWGLFAALTLCSSTLYAHGGNKSFAVLKYQASGLSLRVSFRGHELVEAHPQWDKNSDQQLQQSEFEPHKADFLAHVVKQSQLRIVPEEVCSLSKQELQHLLSDQGLEELLVELNYSCEQPLEQLDLSLLYLPHLQPPHLCVASFEGADGQLQQHIFSPSASSWQPTLGKVSAGAFIFRTALQAIEVQLIVPFLLMVFALVPRNHFYLLFLPLGQLFSFWNSSAGWERLAGYLSALILALLYTLASKKELPGWYRAAFLWCVGALFGFGFFDELKMSGALAFAGQFLGLTVPVLVVTLLYKAAEELVPEKQLKIVASSGVVFSLGFVLYNAFLSGGQ